MVARWPQMHGVGGGRRWGRTLLALFAVLLLGGLVGQASANPLRLDGVSASPARVVADGGRVTVTVRVSDIGPGDETVTLATTRGAFGVAAGPSRVVVAVEGGASGVDTVTAVLVGDGSIGSATITASARDESRMMTVLFFGAPASLRFESPVTAPLVAAVSHTVTVVALDRLGGAAPEAVVTLRTDAGTLTAGEVSGAVVTVETDSAGRARAALDAPVGTARLTARAGGAFASRELVLVGAPARLQLLSLRATINLHDAPFAAPANSLVAVVQDAIGQAVPNVEVAFEVDAAGVQVVSDVPGGGFRTDGSGAVRAHLSSGADSVPGPVVVTARAAGFSSSVQMRIAGPPSRLVLHLTELPGGVFELRATLQDADGVAVATGFEIAWEALNVAVGGQVLFDPPVSVVTNGGAQTLVTMREVPPGSVTVRATVVGVEPRLTVAAALPAPLPQSGTPLQAGLNALVWTGANSSISQVVAPIARVVIAAWRLDAGAGWQAYFRVNGLGEDFLIARGDAVYLFVAVPVLLPDVERLSAGG